MSQTKPFFIPQKEFDLINQMNDHETFRKYYYNISKEFLDIIVGNELAMQKRVNLSIQLPEDDSSLLPVHADTWSGDSPFEAVVWIPLVDCFKTKTMYILPPDRAKQLNKNCKSIYIPAGFAHGFLTLGKENIIHYSCTEYRSIGNEYSLSYKDPALKIKLPVKKLIVASKDANAKNLDQLIKLKVI